MTTFLDANAIRASTFIRHVEVHDTLGSTNDRAIELARDRTIELPALIAARHQTAGRGRGKNSWWSADGALTFSVLLDPASLGITTANWPQLSLATAVAICDALSAELNPQSEIRNPKFNSLAIKWPNDIMLDGAKVCGILIESPTGAGPTKDRLVIGLGMNVNNSFKNAPRDLRYRGTSLYDVSGAQHSLQNLIRSVLHQLEHRLHELAASDARLPRAWQRLSWLSRQRVRVDSGQNTIEGTCAGIAADGALLVQTASKTERLFCGIVQLR